MSNSFKFQIGQIVIVDGFRCRVLDREIFEDIPDYLLEPLDARNNFSGELPGGAGWVRPNDIQGSENE